VLALLGYLYSQQRYFPSVPCGDASLPPNRRSFEARVEADSAGLDRGPVARGETLELPVVDEPGVLDFRPLDGGIQA
jgi:hypothetical protein